MEKICISGPGGQGFTVQIKRKKFQVSCDSRSKHIGKVSVTNNAPDN